MSRAWHLFARLLTIVLAAVLIDAAVETALPGSSVRWVAIGAAVLYALILIGARKLDAGTLAAAGAAALGAVLAYDGWSLGTLGAAGGARIFGQDADVAAAALSAGLLLTIGLSLIALRRIPLIVRLLAIVLVAYALVPLATSLAHGAGLSDALGTNAPFLRDPRWLDGAFVAAIGILPAAAIGSLAGAVLFFSRKRPALGMRLTAFAITVAVATQMTGLEAAMSGFPMTLALHNPNAAAVAATASTGTGAAFQGAFGTSAPSAAASTAATGPASPAAQASSASALANICVPDPATSGNPGAAAAAGFKGALGALGGATPAASPTMNPAAALARKYRDLARQLPCDDYNIDGLASQLPDDPAAIDEFVRDHVALEVYSGALRGPNGTWMARSGNVIDRAILLSKLLATKQIASHFATTTLTDAELAQLDAQRRVVPQDYTPAASGGTPVPAQTPDLSQDRTRGNALVTGAEQRAKTVLAALDSGGVRLTNDQPPNIDVLRQHVWLQVVKDNKLFDLDPSLSRLQPGSHLGGAPASSTSELSADHYATLTAKIVAEYGSDAAQSSQELTSIDGRLVDLDTKPVMIGIVPEQAQIDVASLRNAAKLTAALGAGDSFTKSQAFSLVDPTKGKLRSLRVEITTTQPGHPSRTYVRWILSPADRDQPDLPLRLVGVRALLAQTGPYSADFTASRTFKAAVALADNASHPDAPGNVLVYPARSASFFYVDNALGAQVASDRNVELHYDRPRLTIESWGLVPTGNDATQIHEFDIVDNALAAYGSDGARTNVVLGVLDTSLEHEALGPDAFGSLDALDANPSALSVLRRAPSADGQYAGLQQTFDRGGVALAMNAPANVRGRQMWSWWDVDPNGGATVGRSTGGKGDALVEYAALVGNILATAGSAIQAWKDCKSGNSSCICDIFAVAFGLLGVGAAAKAIGAAGAAAAGAARGAATAGLVAGGAQLCQGLNA